MFICMISFLIDTLVREACTPHGANNTSSFARSKLATTKFSFREPPILTHS